MFSGLNPIRMAVTEDDGANWSGLNYSEDFWRIVTMATVIDLKTLGHYLASFHDDGRFIRSGEVEKCRIQLSDMPQYSSATARSWRFRIYTCLSEDGGLTWSVSFPIVMLPAANLCQPGCLELNGWKTVRRVIA